VSSLTTVAPISNTCSVDDLEKLEEFDYEGGVKVEVAISAQMTNLATGRTVGPTRFRR